jgi:hypothetical protein
MEPAAADQVFWRFYSVRVSKFHQRNQLVADVTIAAILDVVGTLLSLTPFLKAIGRDANKPEQDRPPTRSRYSGFCKLVAYSRLKGRLPLPSFRGKRCHAFVALSCKSSGKGGIRAI